MAKRVLATTNRGRTHITSKKQVAFMEEHHINHTHIRGDGSKVRHTWPRRR